MTTRKRSAREEENQAVANLYSWEKGINASWEAVREDDEGNLIALSSAASNRDRIHQLKKARVTQSIRRGLIRFLVVALDLSAAAGEKDYRPSRLEVCKQLLTQFFLQFYDQNPISQLAVAITRDRLAEKVSDLSGNPKHHIHKLTSLLEVRGLASLQNTLTLAAAMLRHIPNYGSREVLIVYNSLSSCDPGNIFDTITALKECRVRVHVICLSAEIFICKHIAEATGGTFAVALDQHHLKDLLSLLTVPPADVSAATDASLNVTDFIFMGFPKRAFDPYPLFSYDGRKVCLSSSAYLCPRCVTRSTDIPTQCSACNLQLNSSAHIARSFHHLFPVPLFLEYTVTTTSHSTTSKGTRQTLQQQGQRFFAQLYRHPLPTSSATKEVVGDTSSAEPQPQPQPLVLHLATRSEEEDEMPSSPPPPPPPSSPPLSQPANTTSNSPSAPSSPPPPPPPLEVETEEEEEEESVELASTSSALCRCRGCLTSLLSEGKVIFRCPSCRHFFCHDCDLFIHETLHNCPGC